MKNIFCSLFIILFCIIPGGAQMQRSPSPEFSYTNKERKMDEKSLEYQMDKALLINDKELCYKRIEELLKKGANPNKKTGQFKWIDTNPLWKCCGNKNLVKLFIKYGADVKKRPYIAKTMSGRIALNDEQFMEWKNKGYGFIVKEQEVIESLNILLKAGADPDMKWIWGEKILWPATDWKYNHYFKKNGDLPINHAIKYNAIKTVKLLFSYGACLDEKSLELAKATTESTGSSEMEDLVLAQWNVQNKK